MNTIAMVLGYVVIGLLAVGTIGYAIEGIRAEKKKEKGETE